MLPARSACAASEVRKRTAPSTALALHLHRVADVADAHLVPVERAERSVLGVRPELESLAADDDLALGPLAHGDADGLGGVGRRAAARNVTDENRAHPDRSRIAAAGASRQNLASRRSGAPDIPAGLDRRRVSG